MYLLDTNICIALLNRRHAGVIARFQKCRPGDIGLCSIVKSELYFGARNSQRVEANLSRLAQFFVPLTSLPFDDHCAEEAGSIRAELASQRTTIGPNDVLIAATARAHDVVLITHNTGEFIRVPGLRMEDWLA